MQLRGVQAAYFITVIILEILITEGLDKTENVATQEAEANEETVDFGIPDLDPRNPFYKGRPHNVLGTHAEPNQHVDEISPDEDFPDPTEFYEAYIQRYRPVVIRGAAKRSAAYRLWTEEYLKQEYGDLTVRLEARSEDSPRIPNGVGGMGRDTVGNFLDRYQSLDGYIISQLPSPMERDIALPPFLTCGSLSRGVQEVHLFLSATGGKTLLHRDPYSSLHCVFNGTKQWLVFDPTQKDNLYMADDSRYEFGGYSDINVDDVDYNKHPGAKELEFARVILKKGDCIYMPSGYIHQVRSRGYMNSAVSIWFSHYMDFDPKGCEESGNDFKPMSESFVLWRYSGYGELSQGHLDVHILRMVMKTTADKTGTIWLEEFTNNFIQGEQNDEDILINQRLEFTKMLDTSNTGYVTVEDLDALPLGTLKKLIEIIDPSDVSNHEDFEYNHIDKDALWSAFSMLRGTHASRPFSGSDFIKVYTIFVGGTEKVAREILAVLDPNGTDEISGRMVVENGDRAFEKFNTGFKHDPTIEHLWYKQFVAQGIFQKYRVKYFDDPRAESQMEDAAGVEEEAECQQQVNADGEEVVYVEEIDKLPVCDRGKDKTGRGTDVAEDQRDLAEDTREEGENDARVKEEGDTHDEL